LLQRCIDLLRKSLVANLSRDIDQLWLDSMIPHSFAVLRLESAQVERRTGSLMPAEPAAGYVE
jgi:hypothetical protein